MKGFTEAFPLIVVVVAILCVFFYFNINLPMWEGQTKNIELHNNLYSMGKALDSSYRSYMKTAFLYSVYQACYDNLKQGGWSTIPSDKKVVHGDDDYAQLTREDGFSSNLATSTQDNLNSYGPGYSFLDYEVIIPRYSVEIKNKTETSLNISATGEGKLNIRHINLEGGENISLYRNASVTEIININCYGLYKSGESQDQDLSPKLSGKLESEMLDILKKHETTQSASDVNTYCNGILESRKTTASDNIKTYIESQGEGIEFLFADFRVKVKRGVRNPQTGETECEFELDEGRSSAVAKVRVNDMSEQKFPIFDNGDIESRSLSLVFAVKAEYPGS
jgi:hypothetical protein